VPESVVCETLQNASRPDLNGFWIHLDADALDDALMPEGKSRRSQVV